MDTMEGAGNGSPGVDRSEQLQSARLRAAASASARKARRATTIFSSTPLPTQQEFGEDQEIAGRRLGDQYNKPDQAYQKPSKKITEAISVARRGFGECKEPKNGMEAMEPIREWYEEAETILDCIPEAYDMPTLVPALVGIVCA